MKKLDLKYEPRQRRIAFLEWIGQLEIAFSSNKYTKNILKDYSTKNKVHKTDDEQMMYKNKGTNILKALKIKCASVDTNTKQRAKMIFMN